MPVPFVLLGLAIAAVWLPPIRLGQRRLPIWRPAFIAAIGVALVTDVLAGPGLTALVFLGALLWVAQRAAAKALSIPCTVAGALLALALALHLLPGFANPVAIAGVRLTADAAPYWQRLNFDKGAAGLLVLALTARRAATIHEWRAALRIGTLAAVVTAFLIASAGIAMSHFAPAPKLPAVALTFLFTNLFFTCIAEEAFFRGLIQEPLHQFAQARPRLRWMPVAAAGLAFGAAHAAGAPAGAALASIAGFGYAGAYALTRRVEAAIFAHFGVNAIHFFTFTYPHLQR